MGRYHTIRLASDIKRTPAVVSGATRRPDGAAALLLSTLGYFFVYLWAIQDVSFRLGTGFSMMVVEQPRTRMFEPAPGTYAFEPIALIEFGVGTLLVSPINAGIGLFLAVLVGINLALSYLAITQPKSCGIGAGSGVMAALPALLAGSACCAPVILIVLGITASGALLATLPLLLPLGLFFLFASLVYLAGKIDPTVLVS